MQKTATLKIAKYGCRAKAVVLPNALCRLYGIERGDRIAVRIGNDQLILDLGSVRKHEGEGSD